MIVRKQPLILHNIVGVEKKLTWRQCIEAAVELKDRLLQNGVYSTGPVVYRIGSLEKQSELLIPMGFKVNLPEGQGFYFKETLQIDEGLKVRVAEPKEEMEDALALLESTAKQMNVKLEKPYYNISIAVPGGTIVDVYAPIVS